MSDAPIQNAYLLLLGQIVLIASAVFFGVPYYLMKPNNAGLVLGAPTKLYLLLIFCSCAMMIANIVIGWSAFRSALSSPGLYNSRMFVLEIGSDGSVRYRIVRPKFLKLVELLKNKRIKGAIFLCWDRASRNEQDDLLIKKLIKLGGDIRFSEATYDKSSSGDLHMSIDGMFAAHYSRVISEKVRNAYAKLRAEGRCVYFAPIGYLDRGSDHKPFDPERAPIVKRIFELYATGEWSFSQLAKWAEQQGLTKRPMRPKRTKEEILNNVDPATLPKVARPVDHKTIEYILRNPFYVGKIKTGDVYRTSTSHQPLVDSTLFVKVQEVLKRRNQSIHYIDKPFYTYRGLVRCSCGRIYTPFEKKGIIYYRSACLDDCDNPHANLREEDIHVSIQAVLDRISFTDEEMNEIETTGKIELADISVRRDTEIEALNAQQRMILADLDYLAQNRLTLLRTGAMTPEGMKSDEDRLNTQLKQVNIEIAARAESAVEMLNYVIHFSELVRDASLYYELAFDGEKREIATEVFSELVFRDRTLLKYGAKDGFGTLLDRTRMMGGPSRT